MRRGTVLPIDRVSAYGRPKSPQQVTVMSSIIQESEFHSDCAFTDGLSLIDLHHSVPAAFADRAFSATRASYIFISTAQLANALLEAGFEATHDRQVNARGERAGFAKHMIRFRHVRESVTLVDAVPEVILINSHDASSAYELRAGLYRPVCCNGLMVRMGDFGLIRVPHRGRDVMEDVVKGALAITQGFSGIGAAIERMARTGLAEAERVRFAETALAIRYRDGQPPPIPATQLLQAHSSLDEGADVWHTYNVVQRNIMQGGITGRTATGRHTRTRPIRAVKEDVRINTALWHQAMSLIRA